MGTINRKSVKRSMSIAASFIGLAALTTTLVGCMSSTDANVVNNNITQDAENFKVERRIVFINGITDKYLLTIEGKCNIDDDGGQLEVICKIGDNEYKKDFLGLSDNITYMAEQVEPIAEDPYHYKVTFKPETIIPDVDLRTSNGDKTDSNDE